MFGRTVTVKIKFADFRQVTRTRSYAAPVRRQDQLRQASFDLVRLLFPPVNGVRLVGVTVSNFEAPTANVADDRPLLGIGAAGTCQADAVPLRELAGRI